MKTPIDIISGFLGAGKTTLLNEMLKSVYKNKTIAIIENEFGDVNIDADILPNGISITEMTNGCACCTIRSGLIEAIQQLINLRRFHRIVIEPSGVAKLSDIHNVIRSKALNEIADAGISIAVVNPKFYADFSQTLGVCYHDQIENSDIVFLNRIDDTDDDVVAEVVFDLSGRIKGEIVTKLSNQIFDLKNGDDSHNEVELIHDTHHNYSEHACYNHHDDSTKDFNSYTKVFSTQIDSAQIEDLIEDIVDEAKNCVVRIKGVMQTFEGPKLIQWIPGELNITKFDSDKNSIVIIEHK